MRLMTWLMTLTKYFGWVESLIRYCNLFQVQSWYISGHHTFMAHIHNKFQLHCKLVAGIHKTFQSHNVSKGKAFWLILNPLIKYLQPLYIYINGRHFLTPLQTHLRCSGDMLSSLNLIANLCNTFLLSRIPYQGLVTYSWSLVTCYGSFCKTYCKLITSVQETVYWGRIS